jgi:predicted CoA-binding protein
MSEDVKTAEDIAQDFTAMGHSVELINGIIDGSKMADEEAAERQDCVDRNVEHLEIMVAKDFWTNESMTAVNAAITAGKAHTAS